MTAVGGVVKRKTKYKPRSHAIQKMLSQSESSGIASLRMMHGKVNALDVEFCQEFLRALHELAEGDCKAVVLAGNERVFSAGVDLKRWVAEGPDYVEPFLVALEDVFRAIFCFPKPIIAQVQGHAIAGGCMMACACDYRLIGPDTRIGIPELRIGVPLPMTAIEIVRMVAAPQAFQRIVNVGATFVGQQAVDVGLADEVATSGQMAARTMEIAHEYMAVPLATFQITKRQVRLAILRQIDANRLALLEDYIDLWKSAATRASVAQYVKQRLS